MTSIGDRILNQIISNGLVRAEHVNGNTLFIWQGNSAEQLEALVEQHYDHKWPTKIEGEWIEGDKEKTANNIIAALKNRDQLRQLSHRELIERTLATDAADYDVVLELMNRVLPGWEK